MAEYIEREAAIAAAFTASAMGNTAYRDVYDTVNRLRLIPAADVAPVRHGRWAGNARHQSCSECSMTYCVPDGQDGVLDMTAYRYCPNCGARMDGGDGL